MRSELALHGRWLRGLARSAAILTQTVEGPLRVLCEQRIVVRSQFFEPVHDTRIGGVCGSETRIADGDAGVAQKAAPFCTFDGAAAKSGAEFFFAEGKKPFERRDRKSVV